MAIKSITEIDIKGKAVFVRCDFNVPLDENGVIKDDTRIRRAVPTIQHAIGQTAKIILASHLGRPKGEKRPELSLRPVAARLGELLGQPVVFVGDCVGETVRVAVNSLPVGGVLLLENLRFYDGETKNDPEFSAELASPAEAYVNDAFGTAHRAHASTVGVPRLLPVKAAGLLMKEELDNLNRAFSNPKRPVVAVFGGAKVSDKLAILENIVQNMDSVLIGGGMANTFLGAEGLRMGCSRIEENMLGTAKDIVQSAKEKGCHFLLPSDVVVASGMDESAETRIVDVADVPEGWMALDIGPKTIASFNKEILHAGTIVWNGPMGVFELEPFKAGTMGIADAIAASEGFSIVGGGDTLRAVRQAGVMEKISYISTGGGAFMEFMEGRVLPGVAALEV